MNETDQGCCSSFSQHMVYLITKPLEEDTSPFERMKKAFGIQSPAAIDLTSNQTLEKSTHLMKAEELYERAKVQVEQHENWQLSGALILEALKQERKAECTGPQVLNLIKVRPKTKLEFSFRS